MAFFWLLVLFFCVMAVITYLRVTAYWVLLDVVDLYYVYLPIFWKMFICKTYNYTVLDYWEYTVQTVRADKIFLRFKNMMFTYKQADREMNKIGWLGMSRMGLKQGDTIAVMMHNEPAFIWTFFGFLKIGVSSCFINYELRGDLLRDAIKATKPKILVCGKGDDIQAAVAEIQNDLSDVEVWFYDSDSSLSGSCLTKELEDASTADVPQAMRNQASPRRPCCFVFTSGTTGNPKPAAISHLKFIVSSMVYSVHGFNYLDLLYAPLPLYHSFTLAALSGVVCNGATLILREKFSASEFWYDCVTYRASAIQYLGETCRFLLQTPPVSLLRFILKIISSLDRRHFVWLAVGTELRADVWERFRDRFNLHVIGELYSSTEGNCGMINFHGTPGKVGRNSPLIQRLANTAFIKYNPIENEPQRGSDGFCERINCNGEEPGLFICRIVRGRSDFDGYVGDRDLTEKKILRDVFEKGDSYYNSGDLFTVDGDYNVAFHDRVGNTFRWKGQNVSTSEVSDIVGALELVKSVCVYGVSVPGHSCSPTIPQVQITSEHDGRCGMAAITLSSGELELAGSEGSELFEHLRSKLPSYARPAFIRILAELDLTSTFKQRKGLLVNEGFNPDGMTDKLYFNDQQKKELVSLDSQVYADIVNGNIRL